MAALQTTAKAMDVQPEQYQVQYSDGAAAIRKSVTKLPPGKMVSIVQPGVSPVETMAMMVPAHSAAKAAVTAAADAYMTRMIGGAVRMQVRGQRSKDALGNAATSFATTSGANARFQTVRARAHSRADQRCCLS